MLYDLSGSLSSQVLEHTYRWPTSRVERFMSVSCDIIRPSSHNALQQGTKSPAAPVELPDVKLSKCMTVVWCGHAWMQIGKRLGLRRNTLTCPRALFQADEERNYHVFYQLCASSHLPEFKPLKLSKSQPHVKTSPLRTALLTVSFKCTFTLQESDDMCCKSAADGTTLHCCVV